MIFEASKSLTHSVLKCPSLNAKNLTLLTRHMFTLLSSPTTTASVITAKKFNPVTLTILALPSVSLSRLVAPASMYLSC